MREEGKPAVSLRRLSDLDLYWPAEGGGLVSGCGLERTDPCSRSGRSAAELCDVGAERPAIL